MHFFFAPSATRIRGEQIRRLDAEITDRLVREAPEEAYEPGFMERLLAETQWMLGN